MTEHTRTVGLNCYLEVAVNEAVARLASPAVDDVVRSCLATGVDVEVDDIRAHVGSPTWVADRSAGAGVSWGITRPGRPSAGGEARLSLVAVQTGHDPITELVVTFGVPNDPSVARSITTVARSTLDALASFLATDR